MDAPLRKAQQDDWDDIDKARRKMRRALDELIKRIREAYLEVDLHRTDEKAWAAWREFQSDEDEVDLDLTDSVAKEAKGIVTAPPGFAGLMSRSLSVRKQEEWK